MYKGPILKLLPTSSSD